MISWSLLYDVMNELPEEGFEYTPLTPVNEFKMDLNLNNDNGFWKYEEDVILKEIRDYLGGTYKAHYANDNKTQTLDLIDSIGDSEAFCRSNAIKYLSRFGKKEGKSKLDILKAIHYCILLYHFSGINKQPKGNYETF
ncbi:hypothetical protein [Synechococcus phage S-B05]|nr:hypothetical protein [Synechococcus phage S-B05]